MNKSANLKSSVKYSVKLFTVHQFSLRKRKKMMSAIAF